MEAWLSTGSGLVLDVYITTRQSPPFTAAVGSFDSRGPQCSQSHCYDYVMTVSNAGSQRGPARRPPAWLSQKAIEMVYKLHGYKREVKDFPANPSYVETLALVKSQPTNLGMRS